MLDLLIKRIAEHLSGMTREKALARGRAWGRFAGSILRFKRRTAERNLAACLPDLAPAARREIITRMYENLGMNLVEMFRVMHLGGQDLFAHVRFAFDPGTEGTLLDNRNLFLMGHIGNWEALGAFSTILDRPISVVVKTLRTEASQDLLTRSREAMSLRLLNTRDAFRPCLKRLKEGENVSIILDQNTRRKYGVFCTFFGRTACTTPGLAILSATAGVPVRLIYALRQPDGSHLIHTEAPIPPPPGKDPEQLRAHTQLYTDRLEAVIRRHPEQWIWLHDRWRTQPKKVERLQ